MSDSPLPSNNIEIQLDLRALDKITPKRLAKMKLLLESLPNGFMLKLEDTSNRPGLETEALAEIADALNQRRIKLNQSDDLEPELTAVHRNAEPGDETESTIPKPLIEASIKIQAPEVRSAFLRAVEFAEGVAMRVSAAYISGKFI